jgi:CheY-like chemotaxis protein
VLVVDDNAVNRRAVRLPLEALGWLVDEADDGGLAIWGAVSADVVAVVMDCEMPGTDGFTATRALRAAGSTARIIGLTAVTAPDIRARCLAAGMDDHLAKPATAAALAEALAGLGVETVDPARIAMLGAGRAGRDFVAELVDMFVRSIPTRVGALSQALELFDAEGLRFVAHSLRGTAANLGAEALTMVCGDLEAAAAGGRFTDAVAIFDEVLAELDAARDALLALVAA